MTQTRRDFFRLLAAAGFGSAAAASVIEKFAYTNLLAGSGDYKALVCIFLFGGNDGGNTVIPFTDPNRTGMGADATGGYPAYYNARNPQGLAYSAAALTPYTINPNSPNLGNFALHPSLGTPYAGAANTSLFSLYNSGKVAIVPNCGTLIQQITKAQYQAGIGRPNQLFSHSDQVDENQTCIFNGPSATGWGGRMADRTINLNEPNPNRFPMQTGINTTPRWMIGQNQAPLNVSSGVNLNQVLVLNGFGTATDEVARRMAFDQLRGINLGSNRLVDTASSTMNQAVTVSAALSVNPTLLVGPTPGTTAQFPANNGLATQLIQVARLIKANLTQPALNLNRQTFFVSIGGFDTHANQQATQPNLLLQVSQAVAAFYYWLANETNLGDISSRVTLCTLSDFNRTFNPAGTGGVVGSDHAWGNHNFVIGGSVLGGRFYGGSPHTNGTVFPTLTMGAAGPDDTDTRGRWIPRVSTSQYANTLAAWYGLLPADQSYVFPTLSNFGIQNLGFV